MNTQHNIKSDEELMLTCKTGDLEAFAELVRRHSKFAWGIAWHLTHNATEAEDLAQEAFLKVLRYAENYEVKAKFTTWFRTIVTNLCYDYTKKKKPIYEAEITETKAANSSTLHADLEKAEETAQLKKALHNLPAKQRIAITLKYYGQMTYEEIANATKSGIKSVEKNLSRARKNLQIILEEKIK